MAKTNFLDDNGLLYLWSKITSLFVKKEAGKGLSTNDYTTAEKEKLSGIEAGANKYELPIAGKGTLGGVKVGSGLEIKEDGTLNSTYGGTADAVDWSGVQNKPSGLVIDDDYQHTDENYTSAEKEKLAGVATGADVSSITSIKKNGSAVAIAADKSVNITVPTKVSELTNDSGYLTEHQDITGKADKDSVYTKNEIDGKLTSTYKPQGSSAFASLPVPSASNLGFTYNVTDAFTSNELFLEGAGKEYPAGSNVVVVQSGSSYLWDVQGGFYDLSPYAKIADFGSISNTDIDKIVATE